VPGCVPPYAASDSNDVAPSRKSSKFGYDTGARGHDRLGIVRQNIVMRSASGYGSGRRMTLLTTLKIAVVAPIPRARVMTATAVNPGRRTSDRIA
jgi:hypothetical protein